METVIYKNHKIELSYDEYANSPREDDNLGTMICFHNRYNLGDKHSYHKDDFDSWAELEKQIIKDNGDSIILPLYLYDHSGITIKTTPFNCGFDSGRVGLIFISKEKVRNEYNTKRINKNLLNKVTEYLIAEVKTYDKYLTGEIYQYNIIKDDESIDSCYGYYSEEDAINDAKSIIDYRIKQDMIKRFKTIKTLIKNKVPLHKRTQLI